MSHTKKSHNVRKKSSWTAEDSKQQMQKYAKGPHIDPAVQSVHETLEGNLEFFMANIEPTVQQYNKRAEEAYHLNPRRNTEEAAKAEATLEETNKEQQEEVKATEQSNPASPKASSAGPQLDVQILRTKPAKMELPTVSSVEEAGKDKKEKENEDKKEEEEEKASTVSGSSSSSDVEAIATSRGVVLFPNNEQLLEQLQHLKKEAYELSVTFNGIQDWIALNAPDVQDSDDIGVTISETVLNQVSSLEDTVTNVYAMEQTYLEERLDRECNAIKYTDSISTQLRLFVLDQETWDEIERGWRALTRVCLVLHSVLTKNMTTLLNPRSKRVQLSM